MKKKSTYISIYIIISVIGFIFILIYFPKLPSESEEVFFYDVVDFYLLQEYNGIVKDKYYDKKDHNLRKINIAQKNGDEEISLNFESKKLFDFIMVGDSIIKLKDELNIHIKRNELDTIIQLKFENVRGFEKYKLPR